ncbi:MAG: response regulator [Burkholderiaceae bacterium]|nr:response regulator [Burkholderiaceae bacterium]
MNSERDQATTAPPAAPDSVSDQVGAAVVAMLETLLAAPGGLGRHDWRQALAAAASSCVRASREAGLPGFAAACERFLVRLGDDHATGPVSRAVAEQWVSEALSFSAGALGDEVIERWLSVPDQVDLGGDEELAGIIAMVRSESESLAAGGDGMIAAPAPVEEAGATVARDELRMLAQACSEITGEFDQTLGAMALASVDAQSAPAWCELLERFGEQIDNVANAMGFVGLWPVTELLRGWVAGNLAPLALDPSALTEQQRDALRYWPVIWEQWLTRCDPTAAEAALSLHESNIWPAPLSADAAREVLRGLQLVASRQIVARQLDAAEIDLSNTIPADAEQSVVANLLAELPSLSHEFGTQVGGILAGDANQLAAARRVAHTIKGAANTVGIAGIANLTHSLEDVLQVLAARGTLPDEMLGADLADAADCLAEMAENVAGHGPAPDNAADVFGRILAWANALADEEQGGEPLAPRAAQPAATSVLAPSPGAATAAPAAAPTVTGEAAPLAGDEDGAVLRVPVKLMDSLLNYASEVAILLAQVQESVADLAGTRKSMQSGGDRLIGLSDELERLVDASSTNPAGELPAGGATPDFDPLEMQSYGELHTVSRRISEAAADGKLVEQQVGLSMMTLRDLLGQVERLQADIRETALRTRMVPANTLAPRLRRVVRQAARMAGKEAELLLEGGETNIEIRVLQSLADPLAHLLRNAVDHGIEPGDQRLAAGKPATGRITLEFSRVGANVIITCRDDGRGLDAERIHARAVALGMAQAGAPVPASDQVGQWILQAGFSTREKSTQLSGRGIGLDVVQRAVRDLRGRLDVTAVPGQGLCFTMTMPVQLAALPVLVAVSPTHVFALSTRGVREVLSADGLATGADSARRFAYGTGTLPALRLEEVLGLPPETFVPHRTDRPAREAVLLIGLGDEPELAVIVPELAQTRNVIVRPLPPYLPALPGIEGATVLGDGAVASVIDLPEVLATRDLTVADQRVPEDSAAARGPLCLVVDDSVSVRRTMVLFLSDLGFEVDNAADGIEALGRVEHRVPELLLVDLEMPRMNGVELTRALRSDPRTAAVAIIMITSRSTEKHRQLALSAGVDAFLVKPYSEDELASLITSTMASRQS